MNRMNRYIPPLEQITFSEPFRYKQVNPGESDIVWDLPISGGYVAFIEKISVDWYLDTYYNWTIDGILKEKIQRTIEDVESVKAEEFDPPLIAKKRIRFIFFNNSDAIIISGVLCDGRLVRRI